MILILGGGLAGMSTAFHLAREQPGLERLILEKNARGGGLARSRRVGEFIFDYTGHYLHLRDPETTALVRDLLGENLFEAERRSTIHMHGTEVAFPFQAHLHGLPREVVARCLLDFFEASRHEMPENAAEGSFASWARLTFGHAIAEEFMIPYNEKLFGVSADEITAEWVAWSVPRPDLEQVVRGALGMSNEGLGYNARFSYPRQGGIAALPRALQERVIADMRFASEVQAIDLKQKSVTLSDGEVISWDFLVSTLPLPLFCRMISAMPNEGDLDRLRAAAGTLRASATYDVALGIDRESLAGGTHWIYFPEAKYSFYRVGFPSNVCSALAPAGCSTASVEITEKAGQVVSEEELIEQAHRGLIEAGILDERDRIVAHDVARIDPAYVLYDENHAKATGEIQRLFEDLDLHSIGRYGAWTYSFMERALMDGRETAARLLERAGSASATSSPSSS